MCVMYIFFLVDIYTMSNTDFFFNDTATTEIYTYLHTLSLHDALPISGPGAGAAARAGRAGDRFRQPDPQPVRIPPAHPRPRVRAAVDRKSTRLNSSH